MTPILKHRTDYKLDRQQERRKLFTDVAVAYVSAANSNRPDCIRIWCKAALEAFDKEFPEFYK